MSLLCICDFLFMILYDGLCECAWKVTMKHEKLVTTIWPAILGAVSHFFTAQGFCWFYIGLCWVDCHSIAKFIIEFCIWPAVYCTTPGFIRTLPVFTFKRPVTSPPKNGGTRVLEPEWVEKWLLLSVCCAIVDTRERSLSRETKHPDGWERSGVRLLSTLHYRLSSEN